MIWHLNFIIHGVITRPENYSVSIGNICHCDITHCNNYMSRLHTIRKRYSSFTLHITPKQTEDNLWPIFFIYLAEFLIKNVHAIKSNSFEFHSDVMREKIRVEWVKRSVNEWITVFLTIKFVFW